MTSTPPSTAPVGAYLAITAAVLSVVSLALPWYTFDEEALVAVFHKLADTLGAQELGARTGDAGMVKSFVDELTRQTVEQLKRHAVGYRDNPVWVGVRLVTAISVVLAALKVMTGQHSGLSQRKLFAGVAVAFAIRPILNMVQTANMSDLQQRGVDFSGVIHNGPGLYLALFAAVLMAGAAALAHVGDDVAVVAPVEHSVPPMPGQHGGVHVPIPQAAAPQPYMPPGLPSRPAQPQPQPAYAPPAAQAQPALAAYTPLAPQPQFAAQAQPAPQRSASVGPPGSF